MTAKFSPSEMAAELLDRLRTTDDDDERLEITSTILGDAHFLGLAQARECADIDDRAKRLLHLRRMVHARFELMGATRAWVRDRPDKPLPERLLVWVRIYEDNARLAKIGAL